MIRVFIADDHTIVRAGLCQLLSQAPDITIVGEAADGLQALRALSSVPCDVVLLDLSLPVLSGAEVLRRLRDSHKDLSVLILSMYAEQQYAKRLLDAGAAGYLSKDRSQEDLLAAIRQVAAGGGLCLAPEVATAPAPHETLTAREHQIFTLIFEGRSVSEIAAELNLTGSTVSTHLSRIKTKLGVHTVSEIAIYAHRVGLIG